MTTTLKTLSEMANFIRANGTQCRFVSMISETEPKLKKSCPFRGVKKVARRVGMVNVGYVAACERGIAELLGVPASVVDYQPGDCWYQHETTTEGKPLPLVRHKDDAGKLYLQFFPRRAERAIYVDETGTEIPEFELAPHFYARANKPEFKPTVIVVALANVRELRASGVVAQAGDIEEAERLLA